VGLIEKRQGIRPLRIVLVGLCLACISPLSSQAFELFGRSLWGSKKTPLVSDVIGEPKTYQIDIQLESQDNSMVELFKLTSTLYSDRNRPASGSAGLIARAKGDYRRLLAALYKHGYYGGTISITLNGYEVADLNVDTTLPDESQIVIVVDTGPVYHFERADIAPIADQISQSSQNFSSQDFAPGAIAHSDSVLQAEQQALENWRATGYAKAKVTQRDIVADHQNHTLEATIEIDPGRQAHYGTIEVNNTSSKRRMDSDFIARMSGLEKGEIYDPAAIERARKRLARLEVFRTASINEADEMAADDSLAMTIDVQERAPRRLGVGATYSTIDGAGFDAYWLHRNLFGKAEKLRFDARIGGIGGNQDRSFHPENYSYMLGASFTRPGLFTPDTDFISSLKAEREVLESYTATGLYLQSGLVHIFDDETSGQVGLSLSRARTKDDYFGSRNFTLMGLNTVLTYDSRDDKNNAQSGLYGQATLEPFYEFTYGNFITKSTIEGRAYHRFDEAGRFVLAGRAKLGMMGGTTADKIPSNRLFFAGGGGSVRGYGYRNIGVVTSSGEIIGGRSLVEASGEARVEVTKDIGLVGFVDVGQVGEEPYPDFSHPLKWGSGIGFRYKTSLGPIRLDIARPLDGKKGDPDLGLYIGIGQAF